MLLASSLHEPATRVWCPPSSTVLLPWPATVGFTSGQQSEEWAPKARYMRSGELGTTRVPDGQSAGGCPRCHGAEAFQPAAQLQVHAPARHKTAAAVWALLGVGRGWELRACVHAHARAVERALPPPPLQRLVVCGFVFVRSPAICLAPAAQEQGCTPNSLQPRFGCGTAPVPADRAEHGQSVLHHRRGHARRTCPAGPGPAPPRRE